MREPTAAMERAFALLGVAPDADPGAIRAAWRTLVRRYHPDQHREDPVAANRRLADLNAAFDLLSTWTPVDARRFSDARDAAQRASRQTMSRARSGPRPHDMQADDTATEARERFDAQVRDRATTLARDEMRKRAERRKRATAAPRSPAEAGFLAARRVWDRQVPSRLLGFA